MLLAQLIDLGPRRPVPLCIPSRKHYLQAALETTSRLILDAEFGAERGCLGECLQ